MHARSESIQYLLVLRNKSVFACRSCLSTTVILTSTSCYGNVFPSSPLPTIWHHCSLSLCFLCRPLSLSRMAVWLDAAEQPLRSDYLHPRAFQNTVHNFSWSLWLLPVGGALAVWSSAISATWTHTSDTGWELWIQPCSYIIQCDHIMLKEQILTIHLRLSWCCPHDSPELRHQYLPGVIGTWAISFVYELFLNDKTWITDGRQLTVNLCISFKRNGHVPTQKEPLIQRGCLVLNYIYFKAFSPNYSSKS